MKKMIFGVLLLTLLITIVTPSTAKPTHWRLSTDMSNMPLGLVGLSYEHPLTAKSTASFHIKTWTENRRFIAWNGNAIGISYRNYFTHRMMGHFYGLGMNIGIVSARQTNVSPQQNSNSIFYAPYYEAGYLFDFSNNWTVGLELQAIYIMGQLHNIVLPDIGLHFLPKFTVGYRF
ncbi:DUF3575 domain-containing protein [bacterium]|nr:DUF3575 domain-containing protein [bacterium]